MELVKTVEFKIKFTHAEKVALKSIDKKFALEEMVRETFPGVELLIVSRDTRLVVYLDVEEPLATPQYLQEITAAIENWFAIQ